MLDDSLCGGGIFNVDSSIVCLARHAENPHVRVQNLQLIAKIRTSFRVILKKGKWSPRRLRNSSLSDMA